VIDLHDPSGALRCFSRYTNVASDFDTCTCGARGEKLLDHKVRGEAFPDTARIEADAAR
jgi:hypothetical protein